jgi:hypothetical protein
MRGEVLGVERRRRWSDEDKLSIVSFVGIDGVTVTQAAHRCDVTRQQIVQRQPPWPVATTNLSGGSDWRTGLPVWRSGSPDKDLFLV